MRVALISPARYWAPPFPLMYIGTALRAEGHEVQLFEGFGWLYEEPDASALRREVERIREFRPDLVGIGCYSFERRRALSILRALVEARVGGQVICGGRHPSLYPAEFLNAGADFVCIGEGERLVVELVRGLEQGADLRAIRGLAYRENGVNQVAVGVAAPVDVTVIPRLDYSLVDYQAYVDMRLAIPGHYYRAGWLMASRGCPGRCIFCRDSLFSGGMRFRELSAVLDDLEFQARTYGLEAFQIEDDVFVSNEKRVLEFCEGLRQRKLGLKFACLARTAFMSERSMAALKAAGCIQIAFGIESGSQRMLDYYQKRTTVENHRRAMELANRHGIGVCAFTMVNSINETDEDVQATIDLLKSVKLEMVTCNPLTPMPGTVLHEEAVRQGWIDPETAHYDCSAPEPDLCVHLTAGELRQRADRVFKSVSGSVFIGTLLRWTWREKRAFARDMLAWMVRHPRRFGAFVGHVLRGNFSAAVHVFRDRLFLERNRSEPLMHADER
jgi:anaerobic magnesium-protoporphyrin IX monomethyl ester cyclase